MHCWHLIVILSLPVCAYTSLQAYPHAHTCTHAHRKVDRKMWRAARTGSVCFPSGLPSVRASAQPDTLLPWAGVSSPTRQPLTPQQARPPVTPRAVLSPATEDSPLSPEGETVGDLPCVFRKPDRRRRGLRAHLSAVSDAAASPLLTVLVISHAQVLSINEEGLRRCEENTKVFGRPIR